MSIVLVFFVPFKMIFAAVLSFATGSGGFWWPIYDRAVFVAVAFWKFPNNIPNSTSVDDAMTFLVMLNSTCSGPFSGVIYCISVLDFGPRENIHQLCFVPLVLCTMHPNKCGESFRFLCILILRLDVSRCILNLSYLFWGFNFWIGLYSAS